MKRAISAAITLLKKAEATAGKDSKKAAKIVLLAMDALSAALRKHIGDGGEGDRP